MCLPILQSAGVLNEDIADIVYEKPINLKVTRNELYQIEFVLRDDILKTCNGVDTSEEIEGYDSSESSRLRTDVLQTGNGVNTSEEMEGHDSSESLRLRTDVLQTGNGVNTSEEMRGHYSSDTESTTSDIMNDKEDLIACRDCGLVFAHYHGLEDHYCGKKSIRLPMSGEALEEILSGTSATVCCADDLPAYVSDRLKTYVVNMDNCNQEGTHWMTFHFPISRPPELFLLTRKSTYQQHFRNVLIVNGPQYRFSRCQIQPDFSETCGLYFAYYVKMRCQSIKMEDYMNDFSSDDLAVNDRTLIALFSF
ncbi:unnamed protein product [Mytilus coruscus]|uniref:Uncharacterized protein n=1 Tax=Mytilus coruscus TaxID=42192 RepID=A0A6J8D0N2_MYTCO|nr:unnamed protein product [Mytilus coruscus]